MEFYKHSAAAYSTIRQDLYIVYYLWTVCGQRPQMYGVKYTNLNMYRGIGYKVGL